MNDRGRWGEREKKKKSRARERKKCRESDRGWVGRTGGAEKSHGQGAKGLRRLEEAKRDGEAGGRARQRRRGRD